MYNRVDPSPPEAHRPLVYLATKFPALSETFIYEEILALKAQGVDVRFFVFFGTKPDVEHGYIAALSQLVTCAPRTVSFAHLAAHARILARHPRAYSRALYDLIRTEWRRPVLVLKNLYAFGKGVALANIIESGGDLPQHIHAHWATMPTTAALVIAQILGIPFSFTAHAWDIYKEPTSLCLKLSAARFAVTISDYNRKHLQSLCPNVPAGTIHTLRCGIDLHKFPCRRPPGDDTPPLILSVGRLVPKKGTQYLIEACALLDREGRNFRCNIVGDGPLKAKLARQIQDYGLHNKVSLLGSMPQEDLASLWQTATVFALPCRVEKNGNRDGIPVVLMEALATGVAAVSTAVSGIPEIIENDVTGLLVSPDDATALAAAIARLLDNPALRARLAAAGRRCVEQSYNIETNTRMKMQLLLANEPQGATS